MSHRCLACTEVTSTANSARSERFVRSTEEVEKGKEQERARTRWEMRSLFSLAVLALEERVTNLVSLPDNYKTSKSDSNNNIRNISSNNTKRSNSKTASDNNHEINNTEKSNDSNNNNNNKSDSDSWVSVKKKRREAKPLTPAEKRERLEKIPVTPRMCLCMRLLSSVFSTLSSLTCSLPTWLAFDTSVVCRNSVSVLANLYCCGHVKGMSCRVKERGRGCDVN